MSGDAYSRAGHPTDALRIYRDALARAKEAGQVGRLKSKIHVLESSVRAEGAPL